MSLGFVVPGEVRTYGKWGAPVLGAAGPVSLLDWVEGKRKLERVVVGLERAVAQRSEGASGKGEKEWKRQHADLVVKSNE